VLTAVVTQSGSSISVHLVGFGGRVVTEEGEEVPVPESDLNPIAPEMKEVVWGFGSFLVLLVLMRLFLYPRLKRGTDARNDLIVDSHAQAEQMRQTARAEVADYEAQLAQVKAEAAARVEAARQTLETERQAKLAEVNARLSAARAAAAADADAAREAAKPQIHAAVSEVAAAAGQLATGRAPAPDVVDRVVSEVMSR
jgi:F-type H+-transporting ATPase subunit b